ncbi:MAG: glycoside hydrolase family 99-like domain-containing protein [Clostridia bacterium]|nr:glycoside hydrolase family 99-like domain-containing protein [Clostridia bacterium]
MQKKYDIAAFIWPAYTGKEPRTKIFWPGDIGEWQTVRDSVIDYPEANYHWDRKPLWGYRDEADPETMEFQIEEATKHGVNVFIYDWYWYEKRPFLEQCLDDGFLKAKNKDKMKFYLMWANHDVNYTWDKRNSDMLWTSNPTVWDGFVDRTQFNIIVDRVISKYFSQPNYYKIDGKPVFMFYSLGSLIHGLGGSFDATLEALEYFNQKTIEAGFPGVHLQMVSYGSGVDNASGVDGGQKVSNREVAEGLGFSSVSNYQYCHFMGMNHDYTLLTSVAEQEWNKMNESFNIPYYPHVSVGWDPNPRFNAYNGNVTFNNTPENVEIAFRKARDFVDANIDKLKVPLITVNSWNEWTETSYLQPDNVFGYGYLEACKKVFVDEPAEENK